MDRDYLSNKRYCYLYEVDPSGLNIITRHHIIPKRRRKFQYFLLVTVITLLGFLSISHLSLSVSIILTFIGISSCISLYKHSIKKETVIVMPSFGVQLETHYTSGKIDRYFVPIGDILAAVINEAVTPFTCYSYLALILRDQSELMMVFQVLWPPLEILIPTWKSLCTAIDHNSKPSGD